MFVGAGAIADGPQIDAVEGVKASGDVSVAPIADVVSPSEVDLPALVVEFVIVLDAIVAFRAVVGSDIVELTDSVREALVARESVAALVRVVEVTSSEDCGVFCDVVLVMVAAGVP